VSPLVIICTGVAIAAAIIYGLSLYEPPWLEDRKDDDTKKDDPKTGNSEGGQ